MAVQGVVAGRVVEHGEMRGPSGLLEVFDEVGSTNDVARARACSGAPHGYCVRAGAQTAGRGQRGHGWTSPTGGLYMSVILRPQVEAELLPGLPAACGVGAARAVRSLGAAQVKLKWPNDLVAGTSKLAGVLVEGGWHSGEPYAVCGIGINVEKPQVTSNSPGALAPTGLTALLPAGARLPSLDELAELVRAGIVEEVDAWAAGLARAEAAEADAEGAASTSSGAAAGSKIHDAAGAPAATAVTPAATPAPVAGVAPLSGLEADYGELLAFRGEPVELITKEGAHVASGTLCGVDVQGRACIELEGGHVEAFDATDVSLRPLSSPA